MIFGVKTLAFVVLLSFAVFAQKPATGTRDSNESIPPAPKASVIDLTKPGFANEPSIAISPRAPRQVIVAYQKNATVAYSKDAGANWTVVETAPKDYHVSGDVSVTFDTNGRAFLCFIAFDKLGTEDYWAHNATRNGVFIKRSLDGGINWEPKAVPVISHPSDPGIPFEDKPYIVADNQPHSPYRGNLYVGWTHFTLEKSEIYFSRSMDTGLTWSNPIKIDSVDGLPRDDNGAIEGFIGAVDADGALYVVWAGNNRIDFTVSRDGGNTFAPSRAIFDVAPPYFDVTGVSRANGFPQIAVDPHGKGTLFVTWSDYRNGDVDVFAATSSDRGRTWSKPVRVNNDPVHNGRDQFFQWLAVDQSDGAAYVIFYDRRRDPENQKTLVTLARSTDGGKTFANYAWTESPFLGQDDFIGDYAGIAAFNGRVYGAWAEESPVEPQADNHKKSSEGNKQSNEQQKKEQKEESVQKDETGSTYHHSFVRIGIADFAATDR